MSETKLFLSLLHDMSDILLKHSRQQAQEEIPRLVCEAMQADDCAVYLLNDHSYLLCQHYFSSTTSYFADFMQQRGLALANTAVYLDNPEQSSPFFQRGAYQRCLILPLLGEDKPEGILLVGWSGSSPLDGLSPQELWLWQPISQLLAGLYCSSTLIGVLRQREKSLTALYQKAEQELENSRRRTSLELHDEVGQVLTSILLQLQLLQQSEDFDYVKGRLAGLHHITLQTLEEVRRISHNLRPTLLEKLGLEAAVEAQIKEYRNSTGILVEFRRHNLQERLNNEVETIVYRAVQEGLTNVARHAEATKVMINLTVKANHLLLQISDNGQGMSAREKSTGLGLLGMEERVRLIRGKLWIMEGKEQGVSINILLPLA